MNFEPVHIHKNRKGSYENLIFLLIPVLIFVVLIAFMLSKTPKEEVAGVSTGLTQEQKK